MMPKVHDKCDGCGQKIQEMSLTLLHARAPTPQVIYSHEVAIYCSWECLLLLVNTRLGPSWKEVQRRRKRVDDLDLEA
jgi:hypothetical protein